MSNHFSMGAINKTTNKYEYPRIANRINKYKCPSCEKDVIFRNGKIKQPHFAHHKSENPCSYYEKPNETQIHKDAKLLMKNLLDNRRCIDIYRKCYYCNSEEIEYILNIKIDEYNDTQSSIEYKFNHNNSKKSADVALLKNNELKYIFEICYKNKTKEENRPEPWFEIKADTLINETNTGENANEEGKIKMECIRDYKCVCCRDEEEYRRKRHWDIVEKMQIKKREQNSENNELSLMGKEDSRTVEIETKIKLEKENQIKMAEEERELKRRKKEEEQELRQKEEEEEKKEKTRREKEEWKHSPYNDEKCGICNANYCKCLIKNIHGTLKCGNCNKRICKCIKITYFFKK